MCYHLYTPDEKEMVSVFEDDYTLIGEYDRYYHNNAFLHNPVPVITQAQPMAIQPFRWGLVPAWVKNRVQAMELRDMTLNATAEHVFEKPSFKDSITGKRCLVVVKGFYENRHEGKYKYPYYISLAEERLFFLGGLYNEWTDPASGESFQTCSVVTTRANVLMERIHNTKKRMPLIIGRAEAAAWLDPAASADGLRALMQPFAADRMQAHTISRLLNQSRTRPTNVPEVCNAVTYPELALLDL